MTREEEFTHEGFVYANNIYIKRKCELFEVKDIAHDFVQGAIYADQHPREGLWDSEKVIDWLKENSKKYVVCYEDGYSHYAHNSLVENLRKAMED